MSVYDQLSKISSYEAFVQLLITLPNDEVWLKDVLEASMPRINYNDIDDWIVDNIDWLLPLITLYNDLAAHSPNTIIVIAGLRYPLSQGDPVFDTLRKRNVLL